MRLPTALAMFATFMIGLATGRVMRPGEAWAAQATTPANPYAKMLHVGILVDDLEEAVDRWRDMGFTDIRVLPPSKGVERLYHGKPIDVTLKQAFIHGTEPMIELMEPVEDTASPWRDYRAKHGEVIHHLAYRLPDTSTELEKFRKLGLHELAQGKWPEGDSHWGTFHYVQDPDGGVIIEFISRITRR